MPARRRVSATLEAHALFRPGPNRSSPRKVPARVGGRQVLDQSVNEFRQDVLFLSGGRSASVSPARQEPSDAENERT